MNNKVANKIIVYSVMGIFVISLIITSVSVSPLYSRLKKNREDNLNHAAAIRTMAIEEYVTRLQEIAYQVASRTQIRKKLEAYNRGRSAGAS